MRLWGLLMTLAMFAAACGGTEEQAVAPEGGESPADAGGVPEGDWENPSGTIRVAWWGGDTRNEKHNFVNEQFLEAYPEVTLQPETGDFFPHWEKLTIQAAAGDAPCLPQMQSRFMMEFAPRGALRPLDDLIGGEEAPIDVSGLPEVLLDGGRGADGNLYMVPYGAFFFVQMYNADYLEMAGVEEPEIDWTWDEFFAMLADLGENLPDDIYAAQPRGGDPEQFFSYVQGQGQEVFDGQSIAFDRQVLIDWMTEWEELRQSGALMPMDQAVEESDALEESWLALGRVAVDRKAANQLEAHQVGIDAAPDVDGTMAMQKYPNGPEGAGDDIGTNGWSISSNCDNLEASAAYIDFFTNDPTSADYYASDNGVVTDAELRQRQIEDPDMDRGTVRQLELFEEVIEVAPEPVLYPSGYRGVDEALRRAYQEVAFGNLSIEEAVDAWFTEAEGLLRAVE